MMKAKSQQKAAVDRIAARGNRQTTTREEPFDKPECTSGVSALLLCSPPFEGGFNNYLRTYLSEAINL